MGCNCLEKKAEEENELKNAENDAQNKSEPEIENPFNQEEYENAILSEKKEAEEEITNLDSIKKENDINEMAPNNHNNRFNTETLQLINQIRKDPKSYSNKILDNIQYIKKENDKTVFKRKVKVLLNRGEVAFQEAADALADMNPMSELTMKPEIIIPLPENETEINNNNLLRDKVTEIRKKYNINVYFKNMIKNPEIAVLLLIVDDSVNAPGKKRNAILNPEFRKVGIDSKFIDNVFVSQFSFSK